MKAEVEIHIIYNGFVSNYTTWTNHGELEEIINHNHRENEGIEVQMLDVDMESSDNDMEVADDIEGMIHAAYWVPESSDTDGNDGQEHQERHHNTNKFQEYLRDARIPLYSGCTKYTKLSFFIRLFQLKCINRWTNKSFSDLLLLLKDAFPEGNNLPSSWNESKKIVTSLGLQCTKIHACPNDCMLFWKEHASLRNCLVCNAKRYKYEKGNGATKDVPAKLLRHFPLIPRLQRLFMCKSTAVDMTWHKRYPMEDGKMSHPRDSPAWKHFDKLYPWFSDDARNVRLGLASDGFSPFGMIRGQGHSTWPVILMPYNLPHWQAMNQSYFMLSLIIDGWRGPGKHIDVYLGPLIDELKYLFKYGVDTYDAASGETFKMHAAVMWTINDFPTYGMLSGWITRGYHACPCCNVDAKGQWLTASNKVVYLHHRRFLPSNHKFRFDDKNFNGLLETNPPPVPLSGEEVLKHWENYKNITFGRTQNEKTMPTPLGWNKKSIFFELPYWKKLLIRHNLDAMHIEKGVGEHILNTILYKDGKSKDNINARLDLKEMKIRANLHPIDKSGHPGEYFLPPAAYHLNKDAKTRFLGVLKELKLPDGFSSNFTKQVQVSEGKIVGLKSHDYHVLMNHLLPLSFRTALPNSVGLVLNDLCTFFRDLWSKTIEIDMIDKLDKAIPLILCKLEMIFPPSFFDIIVHLTIHLANEVRIAGPVRFRNMYPIERYLLTLKYHVRNKARPEGSIVEGYLLDEVTTFCSRYLDDNVETKLNRPVRVPDGPHGPGHYILLKPQEHRSIHLFLVLNNFDLVKPYVKEHEDLLQKKYPNKTDRFYCSEHRRLFLDFFKAKVVEMAPSNGRARKMKSVASLSRHSAVEPPVKQNFHLIHNVTVPTLPDVTVTPTASREHGPPISFTGAQSTEHNLEQNIAEANIVQNAQGSIGSKAAPDISRRITGAEAFLEQFGKKDASRELDPISFTGAQSTEHNLEQNTAEANVVQNAQGSMGSKAAPDISRRISGNMSNNLQTITLENDLVETNNIAQVCQGSTGTSSNVATSLSRKIYVLPSHLRRSSRKSRSKYRQSADDEAPNNNEIGSTEPIIITSTLPEISSVFRRSRNRVLRSHNPASCRPKPGEDPFPIFWVAGAPVGDYAYKFANYCGEEAKRYDKFPLHERWNETQANHARSIFRNAQIKKEYIFFGEEDPEHEGQRLPVDQRLAERFLVFTIQDIKKDWRSTIKKDYWEAWDIGDIETREAIENGLDSRIPLVQWPALCAYFGSSNKRVEAKRNSENRRSTKRPRLTCTLGRKKQIHAYYDMQKKEGPAFNIAKAFIKCHKTPGTEDQYPNEQTKEYCEQFDEVARDMPIGTQSSFSVISTITDKVSGRHHGGYERGLGRAFSRKLHPAAEKSPIISMYSSKDEQIAALSNRVKELESKEVQRQQSASTPFMQSFSSASGTAVDIGAFMTYMTQFASQMNHFATQIGVPLPPGVPNAELRHNGSGSNGHGGDEDRSFSMHAD